MSDPTENQLLLQAVFNEMRSPNAERSARWHEEEPWSFQDYALAVLGELGEAANCAKKLRRIETGAAQAGDNRDKLIGHLRVELADVLTYLDLMADRPLTAIPYTAPDGRFDRWTAATRWMAVLLDGEDRTVWPRHVAVDCFAQDIQRLAFQFEVDLAPAIVSKFNMVSHVCQFPERLSMPDTGTT